jgi:hypothetical protein
VLLIQQALPLVLVAVGCCWPAKLLTMSTKAGTQHASYAWLLTYREHWSYSSSTPIARYGHCPTAHQLHKSTAVTATC